MADRFSSRNVPPCPPPSSICRRLSRLRMLISNGFRICTSMHSVSIESRAHSVGKSKQKFRITRFDVLCVGDQVCQNLRVGIPKYERLCVCMLFIHLYFPRECAEDISPFTFLVFVFSCTRISGQWRKVYFRPTADGRRA
jgi:hypothetical protein